MAVRWLSFFGGTPYRTNFDTARIKISSAGIGVDSRAAGVPAVVVPKPLYIKGASGAGGAHAVAPRKISPTEEEEEEGEGKLNGGFPIHSTMYGVRFFVW